MSISNYFQQVQFYISSCPFIIYDEFKHHILDSNLGYYKSKLVFIDSSELYLFELINVTKNKLVIEKYRFHYQGNKGNLIKRWDNAPHFPRLKTFPDHLHLPDKTIESNQPTLKFVLSDIVKIINKI